MCALGVGVGVLWFGVGLCLEFGGGRVVLQWDGWGGSVVGVVWIGGGFVVGLCAV